jgi:hypothetical protein
LRRGVIAGVWPPDVQRAENFIEGISCMRFLIM